MNTREHLANFAQRLHEHDAQVCGGAPRWLIDSVVSRLDALLHEDIKGGAHPSGIDAFVAGAIRYIADNYDAECDTLLAAIGTLAPSKRSAD